MIADRYFVGDSDVIIVSGIGSKWSRRIALTVRRYVNATCHGCRERWQFYSAADWICTCGISWKWIFRPRAWTFFDPIHPNGLTSRILEKSKLQFGCAWIYRANISRLTNRFRRSSDGRRLSTYSHPPIFSPHIRIDLGSALNKRNNREQFSILRDRSILFLRYTRNYKIYN